MADDVRPPLDPVSAFFRAQRDALIEAGRRGPVLDLACGRGRHALAAVALGLDVVAVDRDEAALAMLAEAATAQHAASAASATSAGAGRLEVARLDLETDEAPSPPRRPYAAILVFRYLHRPLAPAIEAWLAPGGLLLYETFTTGQRALGWGPTRDAFLLAPGELPDLFPGLVVEAFEEGTTREPNPAVTARLRARKPASPH